MGGVLSVCGRVGLIVLLAGCSGAGQPAAAPSQGALSAPASRSQPNAGAVSPPAAAAAEVKSTASPPSQAGPVERSPATADGMFALAKRYAAGDGVELDMAAAGSSAVAAAKMGQVEAASWLESKAAQSPLARLHFGMLLSE